MGNSIPNEAYILAMTHFTPYVIPLRSLLHMQSNDPSSVSQAHDPFIQPVALHLMLQPRFPSTEQVTSRLDRGLPERIKLHRAKLIVIGIIMNNPISLH